MGERSLAMAILIGGAIFGCKSASHSNLKVSDTLRNSSLVYDFCAPRKASADQAAVWNFSKIDSELTELLAAIAARYGPSAPFAAYPYAYRNMTKRRDYARCPQGTFPAEAGNREALLFDKNNKLNNAINHHLADITSKQYRHSVAGCLFPQEVKNASWGPCYLQQTISAEKWDAMTAAMASTAYYLSSHMALALSALILDDAFWQSQGFANDSAARRIAAVRKFKASYDAFNGFLAANVGSIITDLEDGGFLRNSLIVTSSKFIGPFEQLVAGMFATIRTDSFNLGLAIASDLASQPAAAVAAFHPYMTVDATGGLVLGQKPDLPEFVKVSGQFSELNARLVKLESDSHFKMVNGMAKLIYRVSGKY